MQSIEEIKADFELLEDWEDRYRYLIELGRQLPFMPADSQTDATKVPGCVSQVWLVGAARPGLPTRLDFLGESDAHIVRGLVAIALALYSGRTASEILEIDAEQTFAELGLGEHLTPQRSNGLRSVVARMKDHARRALAA